MAQNQLKMNINRQDIFKMKMDLTVGCLLSNLSIFSYLI